MRRADTHQCTRLRRGSRDLNMQVLTSSSPELTPSVVSSHRSGSRRRVKSRSSGGWTGRSRSGGGRGAGVCDGVAQKRIGVVVHSNPSNHHTRFVRSSSINVRVFEYSNSSFGSQLKS